MQSLKDAVAEGCERVLAGTDFQARIIELQEDEYYMSECDSSCQHSFEGDGIFDVVENMLKTGGPGMACKRFNDFVECACYEGPRFRIQKQFQTDWTYSGTSGGDCTIVKFGTKRLPDPDPDDTGHGSERRLNDHEAEPDSGLEVNATLARNMKPWFEASPVFAMFVKADADAKSEILLDMQRHEVEDGCEAADGTLGEIHGGITGGGIFLMLGMGGCCLCGLISCFGFKKDEGLAYQAPVPSPEVGQPVTIGNIQPAVAVAQPAVIAATPVVAGGDPTNAPIVMATVVKK